MSSSTDKRFSEEDRLHFRAKKTRKLADALVTFEASIERSRPSGVTVSDGFDGLAEEANYAVERAFSKLVPTVQHLVDSTLQETRQAQPPRPVQPDPLVLERSSGWKTHSTGKGEWTKATEQNALREYLLTCKDKTAVLGNYRYKLWGSSDDMLSRWRHGGTK